MLLSLETMGMWHLFYFGSEYGSMLLVLADMSVALPNGMFPMVRGQDFTYLYVACSWLTALGPKGCVLKKFSHMLTMS